jgi:hypothetical protein
MRYFYDTEFIEDGKTIDLISIGVVSEDGREFYAQNIECDYSKANEWVRANVITHLEGVSAVMTKLGPGFTKHMHFPSWRIHCGIAEGLLDFVGLDKPEWWGYYSAYDHVALCQLFGTMMDLPKGWPFYTRDIKQWCDALGNPRLPEQGKDEHHALADAKWVRYAWQFLEAHSAEAAPSRLPVER